MSVAEALAKREAGDRPMKVELHDQTALIVGAEGPIRRALAAAIEANGAQVFAQDFASTGHTCNLRDAEAGLDMLVWICDVGNPQGNYAPGQAPAFEQLCAAAADRMSPRARILAIGGIAGILAQREDPAGGAEDAALYSLVRSLALRLGARKIRVNGLALGAIAGDASGSLAAGEPRFLSHIPVGHSGTLRDLANAALFLLDPENTYMTGHVVALDGGLAAGFARDF
jgi:NAD(P)-dependent dehydrogenase (short-subunit alcohol dehydrogenase family)